MARLFVFALGLIALLPLAARAGTFQVSPILLSISKFGDVAITNTTSVPMRFSIKGSEWTQTATERMKKTDTDKVVYFPQVFTLGAGETQRIRVGMSDPATALERAYRLLIAELPPFNPLQVHGPTLTFLSRADIPVFAQPTGTAAANPAIDRLTNTTENVNILVTNEGNAHTMPSQIALTGRDAAGKSIWTGSGDVWYVLAKSAQTASIAVPAATCSRIKSFDAVWHVDGRTISRTLANGTCR